jgi:hypothetical protein
MPELAVAIEILLTGLVLEHEARVNRVRRSEKIKNEIFID